MIRVCTGFSPSGYDQYGKMFLETFHKYWPASVELVAYTEQQVPMPRGKCASLWECDGVKAFIERHRSNSERTGHKVHKLWKERHRRFEYNFRFDAVKFCRQCFIPEHAMEGLQYDDILVWLDGDVMSHANVPENFVSDLLRGQDIVFLGRSDYHSEIGFWAVRISEHTQKFIKCFARYFRSDVVFDLSEWHSAFVFDQCRRDVELSEVNLTPNGRGNVWLQSPLAKYTDHLKGKRKTMNRKVA